MEINNLLLEMDELSFCGQECESMKMAVGVDLHSKRSVAYATYVDIGEVPPRHQKFLNDFNREFEDFPSTPKWFAKFAEFVSKHECYVLIENSTKTHDVYWFLTNLGVNVVVAQAQDLFRITKSVKKTDSNDSKELAGYMRRRLNGEIEFAECYMPSPEWMTRREMCRGLSSEKDYLANVKRKIRAHLLLHGIKMKSDYGDITCDKALKELAEFKDPYLMMMIRYATDARKRIDLMEKTVEYMFADMRMYQLIYSIPGFGVISAAYFTSLIIDISRFPDSSRFAASFGVVPKMRSSAESNPNCATTHRGDDLARYLLMFCVLSHVKHAPTSVVSKMYKRLVARGKKKREALVAAGRKLLTVVYAVLRDGREYVADPEELMLARETEESEREDLGITDEKEDEKFD